LARNRKGATVGYVPGRGNSAKLIKRVRREKKIHMDAPQSKTFDTKKVWVELPQPCIQGALRKRSLYAALWL